MSAPSFTKGPWRVIDEPDWLAVEAGRASWLKPSCEVAMVLDDFSAAERLANARLIAAAPELYEALSKAVAFAEPGHCNQWIGQAARALAKARGKQ